MSVGIGYDAHRFAAGRHLVLGGVEFASDVGLLGHSDADVATHAIMDALLGAAALGDIGQHFPPGDPAYLNADSIALLRHVASLLQERGWIVGNVDVTIVAEQPRIGPRVAEMRECLASALKVVVERVSVKATTNEGMGFIGRGEGIAAMAVAQLLTVITGDRPDVPPMRGAAS
jgi:2-C-methyl-D-erythritol 2,4-cyclodiphosphate synthase